MSKVKILVRPADSSVCNLGSGLFKPSCPISGKAIVGMGPIVTHLASLCAISGLPSMVEDISHVLTVLCCLFIHQ
ncbi:hypothetical protein VNO77_04054 [Canavalia gladiata]|uniref:Uncharacterized protein n=1 Tax=Canavalia gladiata TaxID=3824 RepID=A0AAN9N2C3_CANGL